MQAAHRVAKNTGILYARMAITMFISLYSTRLVLAALGVADFGLFNVVGGVVAMLGFLNGSMAMASQRFMSFAQGAGDNEKVKRIFNMSVLLHFFIGILIIFVFEIVGYFFFNGILNIEPSRLPIAKLIFQFMVVSTFFTVISVPYEAVITSHENMLLYSIIGVLESVLKLGIAFFITYTSYDHLLMYGLLMASLSVFSLFIRRIYCHFNYPESKISIRHYYDKGLLKEMRSYAGWSLLGSSSSMLANYGQGVVINISFGTTVNGAQGLANQVSGQLGVFATTLIKALNPMIDKSEGAGNRALMLNAVMVGSKISFFLIMVLYIPFLIEMPFILNIWLVNVPEYAIVFCSLLLIRNLIEQLFIPVVSAISAEGNIKGYQKSSSVLLLFPLVISYFLFQWHYPPYAMYIAFIIYSIISSCIILYHANKNCNLSINVFLKTVVLRCMGVFIIVFFIGYTPHFFLEPSLVRLVLVVFLSSVFFFVVSYFLGLTQKERMQVIELVVGLINKVRIKK
jgi:O-antigen/teichoic acid export membrane protein